MVRKLDFEASNQFLWTQNKNIETKTNGQYAEASEASFEFRCPH